MSRHLLVFPALNGSIDFERQERDIAGTWFRSPKPSWISVLLPTILKAAESGCDLTFSTWRQGYGFSNPDNFALPAAESGFVLKLFAPMGSPYPEGSDMWGSVHYFSSRRDPAPGARFVGSNGGLRQQIQQLLTDDFIDKLRTVAGRPHVEIWIRNRLTIGQVAPGCHDVPRWITETAGLSAEAAAAKMNALRHQMGPGEYESLRRKEREAREREAQLEEEKLFEERRQAWEQEQEVRSYVDRISNTRTADPVEPKEAPEPTLREKTLAAKKLRAKISKATKSKVAADAFNKKSAENYATRRVEALTREGKL